LSISETRECADERRDYCEVDGHAKVGAPSESVKKDEGKDASFEKDDAEDEGDVAPS